MKKNVLNLKIILLILVIDTLEAVYEFFFKKGMTVAGEFDFSSFGMAMDYASKVVSNGWIWMGFVIIIIETLMWFAVLAKLDLSVAFPVSSSSYIFVLIISALLLNEPVGINRWIGTALIVVGISIVVKSTSGKHDLI